MGRPYLRDTGDSLPHGTHYRYMYELQLKSEGEGVGPCSACRKGHNEYVYMNNWVRRKISRQFKYIYPEIYEKWHADFTKEYLEMKRAENDTGTTEPTGGGH